MSNGTSQTHPDLKVLRSALVNIEVAGTRLLNAPPNMMPKIAAELADIHGREFQRATAVIVQLLDRFGTEAPVQGPQPQ